jgi:prepilin-type processing-associated H-X9-DG protein
VRDNLDEAFEAERGPLVEYLAEGKVKECPGASDLVKGKTWSDSFEKGCGGYGYNMTYLGSRLWQDGYHFGQAESYSQTTSMSEVSKPFATLMFADCAFYQHDKYVIEYSFAEPRFWVSGGRVWTSSMPSPSIHFRHKGRTNVGWVDGHVGEHLMGDFTGGNDFYTECAEMNLGWFDPVDNSLFDLK